MLQICYRQHLYNITIVTVTKEMSSSMDMSSIEQMLLSKSCVHEPDLNILKTGWKSRHEVLFVIYLSKCMAGPSEPGSPLRYVSYDLLDILLSYVIIN